MPLLLLSKNNMPGSIPSHIPEVMKPATSCASIAPSSQGKKAKTEYLGTAKLKTAIQMDLINKNLDVLSSNAHITLLKGKASWLN